MFSTPGGDTIQMVKTKDFLERDYDIKIDIETSGKSLDYNNYDLIHFFNIIRPNNILPHIESGIPYVVSPIYVDYSEYDQKIRGGFTAKVSKKIGKNKTEYLKSVARWVKNGEYPGSKYYLIHGYKSSIRKILDNCSALLPNSQNELNRIKSDFSFDAESFIVPNAVDSSLFKKETNAVRSGVLCVARIEGLKNQLNLIKAIKQTDYHLTIIGNASPNHIEYYKECRREANDQITFIEHCNQEELIKYYQKSKVHAMVSWFETTGLSSLEAAASGCNIVISDKGDQKDYFKNDVLYANPSSIESIKSAVQNAYNSKGSENLLDRINNDFTWEEAAKITFKAYEESISNHK